MTPAKRSVAGNVHFFVICGMGQDTNLGVFSGKQLYAVALAFVLIAGFLVHFSSLKNDWLNWDDDRYVLENRMVQDLNAENLGEIFSTDQYMGIYHPFTLASYAIDYAFWGKDATGYHLKNLALHLLNIFLLFLLIKRLSQKNLIACMCALLFAIHPMSVETVSWISARKELLYTAFLFLSLLAYLWYRSSKKTTKKWAYGLAFLCFLFSLLSKGTAFVLPFLLLLIDYLQERKWNWKEQLLEKAPFFLLTGIGLYLAFQGQQNSGSIGSLVFPDSIFIASHNLIVYLLKGFIPWKLSGYHPYPDFPTGSLPTIYYLSILPILAGLFFLFRAFKRSKVLVGGISFFLICLLPVSQLIPFGKTIISERYTYLAYVGLFYVIAWGLNKMLESPSARLQKLKIPTLILAGLWLIFLIFTGQNYQKSWRTSESFWSHVIQQYPNHHYAYLARAKARLSKGNSQDAMPDVNESISLNPNYWEGWYVRGLLLEQKKDMKAAVESYTTAIQKGGQVASAFLNRGTLLARDFRDPAAAEADFEAAIVLKPDYALAYFNRGVVAKIQGKQALALSDYNMAIQLEPWNIPFYRNRARLHFAMQNYESALADLSQMIVLDSGLADTWFMRSEVYKAIGNGASARENAQQAAGLGFQLPEGYLDSLP